ncbi:hypothetical protein [Candidatus Electronema sp. TJ]|uniref:hypothetical protein n=1 Tax=Candidatus Electronema sp. TJ TaxID=3401573 RepID=UPI003AA9CBC1
MPLLIPSGKDSGTESLLWGGDCLAKFLQTRQAARFLRRHKAGNLLAVFRQQDVLATLNLPEQMA